MYTEVYSTSREAALDQEYCMTHRVWIVESYKSGNRVSFLFVELYPTLKKKKKHFPFSMLMVSNRLSL